jgi:hypothetical protein
MVTAPFPSKLPLQWKVWQSAGEDPLGNTIDDWADPVTRKVIGWSSRRVLSRDGVSEVEDVDHLDLMVSSVFTWTPKDLVVIPGRGDYLVEGIRDPGHGFHGWQPGVVLSLLRQEG